MHDLPATRWIGGKAFDLVFFFGSGALAVAAGGLALAAPQLVVPLWLGWLLLVDGPHLLATYTRTYLHPGWRREHRALGLYSLLWLLPGFAALATAQIARAPMVWDLFLLVATIWGFHHAIRQHYGILAIYQRHARPAPAPRDRSIDRWALYVVYWGLVGLFMFGHPKSRLTLQLPEALPPWGRTALIGAAAAVGALILAYAFHATARARRGADARPMLFVLLPVVVQQVFVSFVVGGAEPLVAHPTDPEQYFLALAFAAGIVHGMQYLGIVIATNRRRERAPLGRRPWLLYAALVGASTIYMVINLGRGASPAFAFFAPGRVGARLFLAAYWGVFFHHYYVDQKIWHPHADPSLRRELGLA